MTVRLRATGENSSPILDVYLDQIRSDALLTAGEERELAEAIAHGDKDARSRMIRSNLRLVVKIARDYEGRGLALEDLIGEGNLGLIRASQEFDPRFGVRFSTYAGHWIKQAIRHALTNTTAAIRLPAHMVGLMSKWRRADRNLHQKLGSVPSFDQIAVSLGLTDSQKGLMEQALRASRLLHEKGRGRDGAWSLDEESRVDEPPDASIEADDDRQDLFRRLKRLDDRERTILTLRFGLYGESPLTLKEVGKRLGVTREWVRKIENRAVRKLEDGVGSLKKPSPSKTKADASRSSRITKTYPAHSLRSA